MRLIDADKLINFLAEKVETEADKIIYIVARNAINEQPTIEAEPVKCGEWISVKDRLPNQEEIFNNMEFIVFIKDASNATTLAFNGIEWFDPYNPDDLYSVTHWMPLPEPPKKVKK